MLFTLVSFLLVLTVLVLIHELGHFLTAKWLGVKVEEFGFGFPPRAIGKKIGDTIYSINWLPIGGFVKLFGEDAAGGGSVGSVSDTALSAKGKERARAFFVRPVWQRFSIVFSGVFMNFLLAVVLLSYIFAVQGFPTPGTQIIVAGVAKDSPAQKAGITNGDIILAVDGKNISDPQVLINYTKTHLGKTISLKITHKKQIETLSVTPRVHYPSNEGAMGVAIGVNTTLKKYPWYQAPIIGLKEALTGSWLILSGIGSAISQLIVTRQVPAGLAGPVGIAQLTGQVAQNGLFPVLYLLAMLSLNLAILNILPIPALDGGRLFFIVVEWVTHKKVSPKVEGYAHAVGMIVLLALIFLITFHDILRIVSGQSLLPK